MTLEQRLVAFINALGVDIKALYGTKGTAVINVPFPTLYYEFSIATSSATAASKVVWSWGAFLNTDENFATPFIMLHVIPSAGQLLFKLEAINNFQFKGLFKINYSV